MKSRRIFAVAAVALAVTLPAAPASAAGLGDPVTTNLTATILPYAKVTLDETSVEIIIPAGATSFGPVYVGGTVVCNCSTMVFTRITKPVGAPGIWWSQPARSDLEAGEHYYANLLQIGVWDIPVGGLGWTSTLVVSGESVETTDDIETPAPGEVIVTVVPG